MTSCYNPRVPQMFDRREYVRELVIIAGMAIGFVVAFVGVVMFAAYVFRVFG